MLVGGQLRSTSILHEVGVGWGDGRGIEVKELTVPDPKR